MPDPLHPGRTSADKPIRCSVAAVVTDGSAILAVQRPPDDDRLPNVWGLPAVTLRPGELPESGLRRVGSEKLSVPLVPVELLGVGSIDRGDYQLILMDISARVLEGTPDVHSATTSATRYVDQRWTTDLTIFVDAAARGSLCSRILLQHHRIPY